jgi:hypothetical protein
MPIFNPLTIKIQVKESESDNTFNNIMEYIKDDEDSYNENLDFSTENDMYPDLFKIFDCNVYNHTTEIEIEGYVLWPLDCEKLKRINKTLRNTFKTKSNEITIYLSERYNIAQYKIKDNKTKCIFDDEIFDIACDKARTIAKTNAKKEYERYFKNDSDDDYDIEIYIENYINDNYLNYIDDATEKILEEYPSIYKDLWSRRYGEDHVY